MRQFYVTFSLSVLILFLAYKTNFLHMHETVENIKYNMF